MKTYFPITAIVLTIFLFGCSDPAPVEPVKTEEPEAVKSDDEDTTTDKPLTNESPEPETPPVIDELEDIKLPEVETTKEELPKVEEPTPAPSTPISGIKLEHMDTSIKAGDDFYRFTNGKWLDSVEIPADKANLSSFQMLNDKAQEDVLTIIQNASEGYFPEGSNQQKLGDLYSAYIDMDSRDKLGLAPLLPELARIDAIQNHQQLARYFAYANKHGFGTPFSIGQYIDLKDPNSYMIYSWQAGLGLPDREYYTSSEGSYQELKKKYERHISKMLTLVGFETSKKHAKTIVELESKIASKHMKKEKTRDMVALYTKIPVESLPELMPKFNWTGMLEELDIANLDGLVVTQTDYMRSLDNIIANTPIETWKIYLKWMVINQTSTYLTTELDSEHFEYFSKVLYGVKEQRPRWRRGVDLVNTHLGEMIGEVYVKKHFPPAAKEHMLTLVKNLLLAYEESIKQLDWMSEGTKKEALVKLSKFTYKIGYPDEWKDYSQLVISKSDLLGNIKRSDELVWQQVLDKQPGPVQKHEWDLTPQTVNAYYNPPANEIVFPAGILQPPFFNMEAEDAVNYGGIGAVIGHEIGHGFDDAGSTFDGNGALRNWWTEEDKKEFNKRTKQLVNQYNKYTPLKGLHVNGEFTLGENIGDLGGLSIAIKAYELSLAGNESPVLDGFTGQQRVFIGYGQIWASAMREETLRNLISTDPHSPPQYRVNGIVPNVPEFYHAFDVKKGDGLYLKPENRVKIW